MSRSQLRSASKTLKSNRESGTSLELKANRQSMSSLNLPKENLPSLNFSKKQVPVEDLVQMFSETKIKGPLKALILSENGINDFGLKRILKNLVDLVFYELKLEHNNLETHALDYLISFVNYNSNLKKVVLTGNIGITDGGESEVLKIEKLKQKGIEVII